jgi:hypothetical protein
MECPKCKGRLTIAKTSYSFKNDNTPDVQTEAYLNQHLVCTNSKCTDYSGKDINNPKVVVNTISHRLE